MGGTFWPDAPPLIFCGAFKLKDATNKLSMYSIFPSSDEMPLKQMSFRLKPSYFERDGPVCTRSASSSAIILSTFAHMLCGSNDDTMPSFNVF